MAVLWEVQTFKKPCEGQGHLRATTYVLNFSVDLAEITPLHFIRALLGNDFRPKERTQSGESPAFWLPLGHTRNPHALC